MRIFVCVKQVPDTSGKVAVNANGTLDRASMATITNPDDMNAVEAALQLKDATGCQVTVVTMGPPPAAKMLRELIAMGADDGVLISAREFGGSDTFATSQIIAGALHRLAHRSQRSSTFRRLPTQPTSRRMAMSSLSRECSRMAICRLRYRHHVSSPASRS